MITAADGGPAAAWSCATGFGTLTATPAEGSDTEADSWVQPGHRPLQARRVTAVGGKIGGMGFHAGLGGDHASAL